MERTSSIALSKTTLAYYLKKSVTQSSEPDGIFIQIKPGIIKNISTSVKGTRKTDHCTERFCSNSDTFHEIKIMD